MRIVIASSEAVPFAKTGGLADVSSALAKALDHLGHQVWLILPCYPEVMKRNQEHLPEIYPLDLTFDQSIGSRTMETSVLGTTLPDSDVSVLLVDQEDYFHRPGLYQQDGHDYGDNGERFIYFSRSVMEIIRRFHLRPDIIHANDWQTGLIPPLLNLQYRNQYPLLNKTASVFTIHNMAFQGRFWHWDMELTGLDWKHYNWEELEFYDHLNLLKSGVVFSEMVTTVSPTYSKEIQTPEFGYGLENVLQNYNNRLRGILNGVDMGVWNPEIDPHIPANYSVGDFQNGKPVCKEHLQGELGLPVRSDVPLIGMVSRMTDQKGLDLLEYCADAVLQNDVQMCFLGTGSPHFEWYLGSLAERYPDKVSTRVGFDEKLAHRIEAGSDIYLMPSRYEPCGLNQMYSLIYGTIPIVHATGGLADSVTDASEKNLKSQTATGFCFEEYHAERLKEQIERAIGLYHDKAVWNQLIQTAMKQDCTWDHSASEYVEVYQEALDNLNK